MAIVAMLGFDNLAGVLALSTTDTTFPVAFPNLMKTPVGNKDIPLAQYVGTYFIVNGFGSVSDPDGNSTMAWRPYATTYNSSNDVRQQFLVGPPVTDTTLDKTGKWYFGMMVYTYTYYASGVPLGMIGDADTQANNKCFIGVPVSGGRYDGAVDFRSGSMYVEWEIDWVAKTVKAYVDGVFIMSTTFATTPVACIGNIQEAKYSTTDGIFAWYNNGTYNSNSQASYSLGFGHVYFAIDKANDPAPTGRLGPVRVRGVPVTDVKLVGSSVAVGTDTAVNAANTVQYMGRQPTVSVVNDTAGGKDTYTFGTPVLNANEERIIAVQYELITFKDRAAAANVVFNFTDGSTTTPDYTVLATENPRRDALLLSAPMAGGTWTPAKIANVKINVGSIRNN